MRSCGITLHTHKVIKKNLNMKIKKIDFAHLQTLGFPQLHAEAFLTIAQNTQCVISTRTPGSVCELLLRQGYDAKSFFIKSKSCNWGPMAGFLCLDPLMNKNLMKGAFSNLKETLHSLKDFYDDSMTDEAPNPDLKTAESVQIVFDNERLEWLKLHVNEGKFVQHNDHTYTYEDGSKNLNVLLLKSLIGNRNVWSLYYDIRRFYGIEVIENDETLLKAISQSFEAKITREPDPAKLQKQLETIREFWTLIEERQYLKPKFEHYKILNDAAFAHYVPLMGLTNPRQTYRGNESYLNAVTGDYDLYAVWPKVPTEDDYRVMAMRHTTKDSDITKAEDINKIGKAVGNITSRIFLTAQLLNSVMADPYKPSPNRVFHSDECGRPFVEKADEAVFFTPEGTIFRVEGGADLASVIEHCFALGYTCFINKDWEDELLKVYPNLAKMIAWSESI